MVGYGDWTNKVNVWSAANMSTQSSHGIVGVWTTKGSHWSTLYPRNASVLLPYNYGVLVMPSNNPSGSVNTWDLNDFPYSSYDTDNFATEPGSGVLFYSYMYRIGQGYDTYVSFIALNLTNSNELYGFNYQGARPLAPTLTLTLTPHLLLLRRTCVRRRLPRRWHRHTIGQLFWRRPDVQAVRRHRPRVRD